ncbi:558_t:CDS:2, partial [Acaulospora morrowiae]
SAVLDSYISDVKGGKESFMVSKRLYNRINNHKNIESKVIVSYSRSKIGTRAMQHILASNIEWNYSGSDPESSNT